MEWVADDNRIVLSTDNFEARERDALMRDFYGRICMRLDVAPIDDGVLRLEGATSVLPAMSVSRGVVAPMSWERTAALMADGNDDVAVSWISGGYRFDRRGRSTVEIAPGAPCLMPMSEAWTATTGNGDWTVCVQLSRSFLEPLVSDLGELPPDAIDPRAPAGRLLLDYVGAITRTGVSPGFAPIASRHIADLLAFALGRGCDARPARHGVRAARLRALKQHVEERLQSPRLTAETAGRALNLSPRYIRSLFADEGRSFSDYVTAQRLERVAQRLSDPRFARRSIADIAFATGWAEPSTFYRQFKARFGLAPSEFR